MRKLERKFSRELAVIGVHSPKFTAEHDPESVRQAILRLNVGHPVANDREFAVWRSYAVRAWPTLMFIDPRGKVIGKHEGEFVLEEFDRVIAEMIQEFDAKGWLDRRPLDLVHSAPSTDTPLRFPGKLLVDEAGGRLIVSDTGHNRIVVAGLDGTVQRVIGSGVAVSKSRPEVVTETVNLVLRAGFKKKILCGAGIVDGEDVTRALQLGVDGVLVSSSVIKAKDWRAKVAELARPLISARF